jgi:hypothetical protein
MNIALRIVDELPVYPAPRAKTCACPFCGEDPPLGRWIGPEGFRNFIVGCENDDCPANPQVSGRTIEDAWAKWNRRSV